MENKFEPLFYRTRGRETTSFVGVIEKDGKKIKIDFGYKLGADKKAQRLFLFIDNDFNFTASDKSFLEHSQLMLTKNEWLTQFDFFAQALEADLQNKTI